MVASSSDNNRANVSHNIVILDDDEDDVSVGPPITRPFLADRTTKQPVNNGQLWYQIAAHMRRRERMMRSAVGSGAPPLMSTCPQYSTDNNVDPMVRFRGEVLRRQHLMYAQFYHNRCNGNNNNVNWVAPASRVIRKLLSSGGAAARLQYGHVHGNGGGAAAWPAQPLMQAAPLVGPRVLNILGQTGLVVGGGTGDSAPEGVDLTLRL